MSGFNLLGLPAECFHGIVEQLIDTVDLPETARLRAVSKTFNKEILYTLARKSVLLTLCRDQNQVQKYWSTDEQRSSGTRFLAAFLRNRPYAQEPWNANMSSVLNYLVDAILRSEGLALHDLKGLSYMYDLCRYIDDNQSVQYIVESLESSGEPRDEFDLESINLETLLPIGRILVGLPVNAAEFPDETINKGSWLFGTPLTASLFASQLDLIHHILNQPSVNVNDPFDDVLEVAVTNCSIDIVRLLLAPRLDLRTDNGTWDSAVVTSIRIKRPEITRLLLEHDGDCSPRLLADALHEAALTGQFEVVALLLDMGADASGGRRSAWPSPIELAAWKGYNDIVEELLGAGAHQPELKALRAAAEQGHIHTARLLFREYEHPWYSDVQAELLLVTIAAHQHEFLDFLIDEGHVDLSPFLEDEDEFEVLFACISKACFGANTHAVLKLHEAGVPLDGPLWDAVQEGSSAMLMAEASGDRGLIDALLGLGLDPVDPMESIFAAQFESGRFPRAEPKPETEMPVRNNFKGLSY